MSTVIVSACAWAGAGRASTPDATSTPAISEERSLTVCGVAIAVDLYQPVAIASIRFDSPPLRELGSRGSVRCITLPGAGAAVWSSGHRSGAPGLTSVLVRPSGQQAT